MSARCQCDLNLGECCPDCHEDWIGSVEVGRVWYDNARIAMEEMERADKLVQKPLDRLAEALERIAAASERIAERVGPKEWTGVR